MVMLGALIGAISFLLTSMERWDGTHSTLLLTLIALVCSWLMIPALPGMQRDVRGNGEMFPLNGPCWSLFFEYIGNILYALIIRRLSTRALAWLTALLCCALTWFAVTNQSGYGSIGVGWTVDTTNLLGGTLRMLCPFTIGMLMSRVFKPIKNVRGAFWICTIILLVLFHVPFIDGGTPMSLNGIFEVACIICIFPIIVWLGASGTTTDNTSRRICRFLGDISFPLYIVHYPLMYAFYMWLMKTRLYTFSETWPIAISTMACSVCIAWLSMRFYDEPIRKWLKKFAK